MERTRLRPSQSPCPRRLSPTSESRACFTRGMALVFASREATHGPDKELEYTEHAMLFLRVIRELQSRRKKLVPRFVHDDLHRIRALVDVNIRKSCGYLTLLLYTHNECEFPLAHPRTSIRGPTFLLVGLYPWLPSTQNPALQYTPSIT